VSDAKRARRDPQNNASCSFRSCARERASTGMHTPTPRVRTVWFHVGARQGTERSRSVNGVSHACGKLTDHPALIAPSGERGGYVDTALAKLGKERRVALMSPHFLSTPFMIAASDLVLTLAGRVAHHYVDLLPVALFKPPIPLPRFQTAVYWHQRDQQDSALTWFRGELQALDLTRPPGLKRSKEVPGRLGG
jgi:hypothetical protein